MDLLDFFRGVHAWPKLHRLIRRLPASGRYKVAMAEDDEFVAAQVALSPEMLDTKPGRPPLSEWGTVPNLLAQVVDRIGELIAVTASSGSGKKPPKVEPLRRPDTALSRIRREVDRNEIDELVSLVKIEGEG